MKNTQEVERIRALLADMQRPHTTSVWLELEGELTRLVPALLSAYDAQAAVIEAAGAVDAYLFPGEQYVWAARHVANFEGDEFKGTRLQLKLHDALAGLKGDGDGTR